MKLWQVIVLSVCCGCSLDTAPEGHADPDAARLQPVSFGAWRRLLANTPGVDAAHAGAGAPDAGSREPVALDAGTPQTPAAERASPAMKPAASSGRDADLGDPAAADGGTEPAPADATGARDAGRPETTGEGAPATAPPLDAGGPDSPGEATNSSGPTSVSEGEPSVNEAQAHAARVAERRRLLGLVQTTVDNAFGLIWTPESADITRAAAELEAGPEDAVARPAVADLLIRLSRTSGCRADNPRECSELCAALDSDCTVCRGDDTCQSSVEHMCAAQGHFDCRP